MVRIRWVAVLCLVAVSLVVACGGDDGDGEGTSEAMSPTAEVMSDDQVLADVTTALEQKNGWAAGSAEVTLDGVEDERFAHGGVHDEEGSGALWFAELVDGSWEIVWDGNGIVDCAMLEAHEDFPTSLLPQCVEADGSMRTRE